MHGYTFSNLKWHPPKGLEKFNNWSYAIRFLFEDVNAIKGRNRLAVLGNFWRLEKLLSILATLSNFWLSEQLLSNFVLTYHLEGNTYFCKKLLMFSRVQDVQRT